MNANQTNVEANARCLGPTSSAHTINKVKITPPRKNPITARRKKNSPKFGEYPAANEARITTKYEGKRTIFRPYLKQNKIGTVSKEFNLLHSNENLLFSCQSVEGGVCSLQRFATSYIENVFLIEANHTLETQFFPSTKRL